MEIYDLIVIGGGPAGTAAAITAARSGARVLLLERGRFPRHKVCGEFVSAESLDLLSSLLVPQYASLLNHAIRISRTRLLLDGHLLEGVIHPPAASIARLDLDAALWQSALDFGVQAFQHTTATAIEGAGPFRVATTVGELEAKAVINASGRWSNLRTSDASPRKKWIGLKAHFAEPSPSQSVDLYFFDGGYCGVSPVDLSRDGISGNRVNACAMVRAEVASSLEQVFQQHSELRDRSHGWRLLSEPVTTSPLIFRDPQPEKGGVLFAGDAAAFVDPFVGDGISLSLRSGALAAQCLLPYWRDEVPFAAVIRNYREAYTQWLAPVLRSAARIRRVLLLPEIVRRPVLTLLERTPAITEYLVSKTR